MLSHNSDNGDDGEVGGGMLDVFLVRCDLPCTSVSVIHCYVCGCRRVCPVV